MIEKGILHAEGDRALLGIPPAFFDPKSVQIVKVLKNTELLPEDICSKTSYDEKTVVPILLNLHVYGVLKRKQKGFKGYYSIAKDRFVTYCKRLRAVSENWKTLLQEIELEK